MTAGLAKGMVGMAHYQAAIGDAALIQHRTGWLRPDSVVIGSPSYGHVESVLAWSPEYTAWVRALGKL